MSWPISPGPSCPSGPRSSLPGRADLSHRSPDQPYETFFFAIVPLTDAMPYTTFLAIGATIGSLVLSACGGSSGSGIRHGARDVVSCRESRAARELAPGQRWLGDSCRRGDGDHRLRVGNQRRPGA